MSVNKPRRQLITGTLAGAIGAFLGSEHTQAAPKEQPNCSGLPAEVSGASTWLALRFVHQGKANANMLAPMLPGRKTTTVDDVLRYGFFCNGYAALNRYMYLGKDIRFQGAAAAVEQPEILFEDFKLENPDIDVRQRAEAEYGQLSDEAGRILQSLSRQPSPKRGVFLAFKFRGQTHGSAGFTVDPSLAEHMDDLIAKACVFRSLDEIRLWRLQHIGIDLSVHDTRLRYGCGFKKEELGGLPNYAPVS